MGNNTLVVAVLLLSWLMVDGQIVEPLECPNPIQCVTATSFAFCSIVNGVEVLDPETYECPAGQVCMGDAGEPCSVVAPPTESPIVIDCGPKGIVCWDDTVFQQCSNTATGVVLIGQNATCGLDEVCDAYNGDFACVALIISTTTTSTTTTTTTPTPTTTTTTTTLAPPTTPSTTTTTTTPKPIVPPTCTTAGNHQAPRCDQYYACIKVMWWYEVVLKTCGANQVFDLGTALCANDVANTCIVA